ncbi:anaerobic glycerol-3-phosphate dehydrogenase subunit C [Stieleria varia]|uniref:Anaerobic glycerol-3-phosphate dehydrogenase subunit C n=1 Tax=Stieleria varia TaxID=2528005 RepID=A0A5C6B7V7_9BACT|nr:anaerobic glycerol-3-phosphate dehydrogenase subunit C [Stieleria varia]TWU08345.1 Anaerobic glycerol-3-phosphate dehydrogenase subunit C [Stieleria varia]
MEIDRQRVQDDLRGIVRGDVMCDRVSAQIYASDASIYQMTPIGVVRPQTASDVIAVMEYADQHDLAIHARGGGSGSAGESIGRGLVMDFSRYMRRIDASSDGALVTLQSGSTLAELNRNVAKHGRWFGPDPMTRSITTIGGVLSTNASGSHFLRSGSARDAISSMRVVTADGNLLDLSVHRVDEPGPAGRLARGLLEIRNQYREQIEAQSTMPACRGGYRLDGLFGEDTTGHGVTVDLAKFMVGTQGTLALIVDATVRTELIPKHRGVLLLFFHRLEFAARCAVRALEHGLVACDMMDRRLLEIARETESRFASILPRETEAMLLIELQGESLADLNDRLALVQRDLSTGPDAAFASTATTEQSQRDMFWALCRRAIPRLARVKGAGAPVPFTEDIAVPPEKLPRMLTEIQDTLKKNQTTATIFAHAGHGQLHVRPFLNLRDPEDHKLLVTLSQQIAEVVWRSGGHIGGEHATGLSRSYLMPKQFDEFWPAMGQIKRLFDPQHRLNPGKLFGAVLQRPNENLRPLERTIEISADSRVITKAHESVIQASRLTGRNVPQLPVLQSWPPNAPISRQTESCNGCARCRTTTDSERMCPVFRATRREEASPRAKANLLRGVLSGQIPIEDLAGARAKEFADLCFNCHQCRVECPANVDIPKIVGELKAQYVATNGLPFSDQLIGRIDTVAAIGSRLPWISNLVIRNSAMRWLAEKLLGLSAARELPPLVGETFIRHAAKRRWTKSLPHGGTKVVYFVDHYANYHDPDIGRAFAEILQQNGIGLYVPTSQANSGMPRITAGDLKGARKIARRNVRLLSDAVRQGYTVVATEPAAALCLKHEYPNLLDDEDAHVVAKNSHEACQFLWSLHENERLNLDFHDVDTTVAYHQPCHLRVLDPTQSSTKLLGLIPGLGVETIRGGCTGMAGTWGLQRKNYRNSLRIGWPMISAVRNSPVQTACTECSACKMQIEHGSGRDTLHPLKLLAYAYGRFPKIETMLMPSE